MSDCRSVSVPVTLAVAAPSRATAREQRLTLALVAVGMFMAVLDSTIVNVALPAMRTSLGATVAELAWIVDAYTLSFAALILAGGALSDRFGAKRVYLAGLALFVGASAACGVASSVAILVAARFVQGMGAALFCPHRSRSCAARSTCRPSARGQSRCGPASRRSRSRWGRCWAASSSTISAGAARS